MSRGKCAEHRFISKTVKSTCSSQNFHYRLKEMHNHNFNNVKYSKLLISNWLNNVRSQIRNKSLPYSAIGQQKKENLEFWNFFSITDQLVVNNNINRVFLSSTAIFNYFTIILMRKII